MRVWCLSRSNGTMYNLGRIVCAGQGTTPTLCNMPTITCSVNTHAALGLAQVVAGFMLYSPAKRMSNLHALCVSLYFATFVLQARVPVIRWEVDTRKILSSTLREGGLYHTMMGQSHACHDEGEAGNPAICHAESSSMIHAPVSERLVHSDIVAFRSQTTHKRYMRHWVRSRDV
eukprot:364100-Chlamydomonas_euryale.AAC.16